MTKCGHKYIWITKISWNEALGAKMEGSLLFSMHFIKLSVKFFYNNSSCSKNTRCLFGTKRLLGLDKHEQWCNTLDRQDLIPESSNEILHNFYIVKLENFRLWKFELRERADLYKKTKYQKFFSLQNLLKVYVFYIVCINNFKHFEYLPCPLKSAFLPHSEAVC